MELSRWVDEYVSEWQGAGVLALLIYWLTDELNDQMKSWLNYQMILQEANRQTDWLTDWLAG